ncbi:MAG: hypothetical protein FJ102_20465, partial [Deltaproteobacteria bacterium]|nr:hypothetical protein [Deltaproteobacteria bacterium]
PPGPPSPGGARGTQGGGQPPPLAIPANDPSWAGLHGLLSDARQYGEANWDDVRMRVVGQLGFIHRDLARARAMAGDWSGCARAYTDAGADIDAVVARGAVGEPIKAAVVKGMRRDAALCVALAEQKAPSTAEGTVATLWAAKVAAELGQPWLVEPPALVDIDPDDFKDFEGRHRLRVRLVEAYTDAVDPFFPSEAWGYWDPRSREGTVNALLGPAKLAAASRQVADHPPVALDAHQLGDLPTGDALVDVASWPGPRAIGSLSVRDVADPEHGAWLAAEAERLLAAPDFVVALHDTLAYLDKHEAGSRYYNVKQARNAGVRYLASRGRFAEADALVAESWPLHGQDWACPNREGILLAIRGRLQLRAGAPEAEATLRKALEKSHEFLAHTTAIEGAPRR